MRVRLVSVGVQRLRELAAMRETAELGQWQWANPETVLALLDVEAAARAALAQHDKDCRYWESPAGCTHRWSVALRAALARLEET